MKITDPFIGMEVIPPKRLKDHINCFITSIHKDYVMIDIVDSSGLTKLTPQTMINMEDLTENWRAK